jgi:hypothetical protein
LAGLIVALAGALQSHGYAVIVMFAFGLAEAARSLARRRLDWAVLGALALPCPVVLSYLSIFSVTKGVMLDNPVYHASINDSYEMIFGPALWPMLLAGWALTALAGSLPGAVQTPEKPAAIPFHELMLAAGLGMAPVFGYWLARTVTRVFFARYGIPAILGASILLGALVAIGSRVSKTAALAVVVIFAGTFTLSSARALVPARVSGQETHVASDGDLQLSKLSPGVPIVIANVLLFLEYDHYEAQAVTDRMYFLTSREAALQYTGTTGFDAFYQFRKWYPIRSHLEDYHQFLSAHRHFFIVSEYDFPLDWTLRKMKNDGVPLIFKGQYYLHHGPAILAEVNQSGSPEP